MDEPKPGANPGEPGALPAASPPANPATPPNGDTPPPNPAAEPSNLGDVPFNLDPRLKSVVEYLERTLTNKIERRYNPAPQPGAATPPPPMTVDEEMALIDKETEALAAQHGLDKNQLKSFLIVNKKLMDKKLEKVTSAIQSNEIKGRFSELFTNNKEAAQLQDQMGTVFSELSPADRQFVLTSPDGPKHLYWKTKELVERNVLPPAARIAGGNPPSRGTSPDAKTGTVDIAINKTVETFLKGDKRAYEENFKALNK